MKSHISGRRKAKAQPLTALMVRQVMRRIYPRKNDYVTDLALFEELLPELRRFGIHAKGDLQRLMTRHRAALLRDDRSPLLPWEQCHFATMFDPEFVRDAVRRHYWFAYPGFVRNALQSEFGEIARVWVDGDKDESLSSSSAEGASMPESPAGE